jgi:hypothetical protein
MLVVIHARGIIISWPLNNLIYIIPKSITCTNILTKPPGLSWCAIKTIDIEKIDP